MVRSLLLTCVLLLCAASAWSQSTVLQGTVTDDKGETLIGASVKVLKGTDFVRGALTDVEGRYRIQLDPGSYNVEVSYTGYALNRTTGVQVLVGKINFLDVTMSSSVLTEVVVSGFKVELVEQDKTSGGQTLTSDQIRNLPTRSVNQIVATTAGTTSVDGGEINIKGSRSNATNYFLDGIRVAGSPPPVQDIEQLQVVTGGLGAEYGDVTGGIISVVTKGPASEYHGAIETETSYGLDPYGWLLTTGNVSGPIWKKRFADGSQRTIVGFRMSGQFLSQKDDDPPATARWRPKADVLDRINRNPLELYLGTPIATAESMTNDSVEVLDYNPYEKRRDIDLTGKIDFRLTDNIDLSLTGTYKDIENQFTPGGWQLLNAQNNPTDYDQRWRVIGRLRHRLGATESSSNVSITNASYQLQFGFERNNGEVNDPRHQDRIFDYGYVGRFAFDYEPVTGINDAGDFAHIDNRERFQGFAPGYLNSQGQVVVPNAGLVAYNAFAIQDAGAPGAYGSYLAQNGRFSGVYNNIWGGMHTNINQVYNSSTKNESDILTIQASAGFDLKLGATGTHNIQFGILNEQRTLRSWAAAPFRLWEIMSLSANSHFNGLDTNRIIGKYWDPQISPIIGDSIAQYANAVVDQSDNRFYRRVRQTLQIPIDQWVNVHELSPEQLSLSMFSPRELADQGLIGYYGYDYLGNKLTDDVTFNDFFTKVDPVDNVRTFPVAPLRPTYQAAWLKDKFTFNKMIFSLGVRLEVFDLNTRVMKDPYSLYEPMTAADFHRSVQGVGDKPAGIGDDFKVYVESPTETTVKAYRSGNTWYYADGRQANDGNVIFGGGVVTPYLRDTIVGDDIFDRRFDPNTAFEDYTPQVNWLPRLAFSFPISKEANFFAHYDVLVQRPPSNWEVTPLNYLYFYVPGRTPANNANLLPERVVDYEVGFQQLLTQNSAIKFSAYYREMRDMIQRRTILYVPVIGRYDTYGNIDFGTVKGFTFQYDLRRIQNAELRLAYTLQFADGTGSNANSQRGLTTRGNIRTLYPLDFDERHNIQAIFDYRFASGEQYNGPRIAGLDVLARFGANLQLSAVSGRPYTARLRPTRFGGEGIASSINGNRLPWRLNLDLRLDKSFTLNPSGKKPLNLNVYFRVSNLLDTRNVVGVYTATGSPTDDGYLASNEGLQVLQGFIEQGRNIDAYLASYSWVLLNPNLYSLPRRMYMGAVFEF